MPISVGIKAIGTVTSSFTICMKPSLFIATQRSRKERHPNEFLSIPVAAIKGIRFLLYAVLESLAITSLIHAHCHQSSRQTNLCSGLGPEKRLDFHFGTPGLCTHLDPFAIVKTLSVVVLSFLTGKAKALSSTFNTLLNTRGLHYYLHFLSSTYFSRYFTPPNTFLNHASTSNFPSTRYYHQLHLPPRHFFCTRESDRSCRLYHRTLGLDLYSSRCDGVSGDFHSHITFSRWRCDPELPSSTLRGWRWS